MGAERRLLVVKLVSILMLLCGTGTATAKSIRDMLCPTTIYGKWYASGRSTKVLMGTMELSKDRITFELAGNSALVSHEDTEGRHYFELAQPIILKNSENIRFIAVHLPSRDPTPWYPDWKCMAEVVTCETREDILKDLQGRSDIYCSIDSFLPWGHAMEMLKD